MRHVAYGVNMNQQTNTCHNQQHDGSKTIQDQIETNLKETALQPGKIMLRVGCIQRIQLVNRNSYV